MSAPIGPYTPIVRAGPWLICSGQLGLHQPPGRRAEPRPRPPVHRCWSTVAPRPR